MEIGGRCLGLAMEVGVDEVGVDGSERIDGIDGIDGIE